MLIADNSIEKKTNPINSVPVMETALLFQTEHKHIKPQIATIMFDSRRYPRFDIKLPIEYYRIKSSITHTGNISENGLLIYFPEEMILSQSVRLKLFFSLRSELNTIEVLAQVVWMDNHLTKAQKNYPYGIRFIDISGEDRTKLRNFLTNLSSES
jgi:c-di-GMP-binding flagellar brake protein YcgR